MKVVNATWEKRNLLVDTVEITIESNDSIDEINAGLDNLDAEYCVLRIPANRADLLFVVQEKGYVFVEDSILISSKLKDINRSCLEQRFYDAVEVERADARDIELICSEINKGLFNSDRIFLDPMFGPEIAQKRYINWLQDEYERGTDFYKYIYKNKFVGFFGLREVEKARYTSFLGGIFTEYQKGGIGAVVKVPEVVKRLGGREVSTNVSSNNPAQLRNLIMNGYTPECITHIFIKHNI